MKKAFVTTVYNDESGIRVLLDSLLKQSIIPDEVIVVDAKSTDKTYDVIKSFKQKFNKISFKALQASGNRSIGRNIGIKKTKCEVIALSDSSCALNKDWFEKITKPFENLKNDVVAGYYKPITKNMFQKSLAAYTCFPEEKLDDSFLPSSRSIAFRKIAWEKVRGYPEELDTCEDLIFAKKLKDEKLNFFVEKKAIVMWPQRKNLLEAFMQFYVYAKGDGKALYIRPQTPLLYLRFFLTLFLLINKSYLILLFFVTAYLIWAVSKNYRFVNRLSAIYHLPLLQITADIGVLVGMTVGIYQNLTSR